MKVERVATDVSGVVGFYALRGLCMCFPCAVCERRYSGIVLGVELPMGVYPTRGQWVCMPSLVIPLSGVAYLALLM